jgi:diguanylate cyclase (GGDEF)-like protein
MSVTWIAKALSRLLGWVAGPVEPEAGTLPWLRRRCWAVNAVLFSALAIPTLLVGGVPWPFRLAATCGLLGACVWEAVALRAQRFPLWADVLEVVAIVVVSFRWPAGRHLIVFVLAFVLPSLAFRALFSSPWQAVARSVATVLAVYAGLATRPFVPPRGIPTGLLTSALVAYLAWEAATALRRKATIDHHRRVAARLIGELSVARGRSDVYAAVLQAVLDLLPGRADVRVIIWDEADNLRPTAAAGALADAVRTTGGKPLTELPNVRDALVSGESIYVESSDADAMREVLGFAPLPGVDFFVPLRHREQVRALSVAATDEIPAWVRDEIEEVAKAGEIALGSIALSRASLEGLRERSYRDPRTGLANPSLLGLRLEQALARPERRVALLLIHIDHFRVINDSLGTSGGDACVGLAARLRGFLREGDTVARLEADRFAILLEGLTEPAMAAQVAGRVISRFADPLPGIVAGSGTGLFVHASIGVALSGPGARSPSDLQRNAEVALDAASNAGGGTFRVFDQSMRESIADRLELESDLAGALDRDEFVLHYQPIVQLAGRKQIAGVEGLVRWNHPRRGRVSPAQFIPAAEETGVINHLGAWVVRQGCRQLRAWAASEPRLQRLTLNVNVSPVQLVQPDLPATIGKTIDEVGVDPRRVVLELTENIMVDDSEGNLERLRALKANGMSLAVDDFGTGFCSLSYLQRFPFDEIKIDRSFVHRVEIDEGTAAITNSILSMGNALHLTSLAEGVETHGEMDWLTGAGCDAAQGYYFSAPAAPDRLLPLLTGRHPWRWPSPR